MSKALYEIAYERLPERFRKPRNLDLYYVLYGYGYDEMYKALDGVKDSRDISKAYGESLDLLGTNVGEYRNGQDDDRYRLLIQTRILANLSMGDIPTINKIMSVLFEKDYLGIEEGYLDSLFLYNEPASFKLYMNGDSPDLPYETLDRIRAAAVRVMVEMLYQRQVTAKSSAGLDSYLIWLCGENLCGDIPYIRAVGKAYETALSIKAGSHDSKNYYGMPGKDFRSADLYGYDPTEIRYIQDVGSIKIYDFGGKDD